MDDEKRLWGFVDNNELVEDLMQLGTIDNEKRFLMWVMLPSLKKGKFSNKKDYIQDTVKMNEELLFPNELESINLYEYVSEKKITKVKVLEYPERDKSRRARIDSVIVETI
jgi:hypothetical protein